MDTTEGNLVIVGASGYWGSILTRSALELFGVDRVVALDVNSEGLEQLSARLVSQGILGSQDKLRSYTDITEVLNDKENQYFVVATPPAYHYEVSMQILSAGRHIMIAKPVALSSGDAEKIEAEAAKQNVVAMVDHTFLFHPAVDALVSEVKSGAIGKPKTFYADWLSRGKIQDGADVIWDLAPHPLSILLEFWSLPIDVTCKVLDEINGVPTEASLFLTEKSTNNSAVIHVSWMDGNKSRVFKVRGSHHTIIFDDTQKLDSKLKIKGGKTAGHPLLNDGYEHPVHELSYTEEKAVPLEWQEPLKREIKSFIKAASSRNHDITNSIDKGVACVKLIEAAESSISKGVVSAVL